MTLLAMHISFLGFGCYRVPCLQVSVVPPPVLGNKQLRPQQLVSNSSNCQLVPTVNHNLGVVKIATVL